MIPGENILVVGGEYLGSDDVFRHLQDAGYRVERFPDGSSALRRVNQTPVDLVLTEWDLPDLAGGAFVRRLHKKSPRTLILAAGPAATRERRHVMSRDGVEDYLELPLELSRLAARVKAAFTRREEAAGGGQSLMGRSDAIRKVLATISQIAPTNVTVLVTGESGTGKELVARAIHEGSPRRDGPFVAVNSGAIPSGLVESELFGHERGAFTGAQGDRRGRFELADGGTLFLDEIGELPPPVQVELLRVLEEGTFHRVGGSRELRVDARIVAATNRDLRGMIRDGSFRQDLYYRLNVVNVELPPLRHRREDIPLLVEHFMARSAQRNGVPVPRITEDALRTLAGYHWPGNVRELRNVVDSLVVLKRGSEIGVGDLPPDPGPHEETTTLPLPLSTTRVEAEREILFRSLLALRDEIRQLKELLQRHLPEDAARGAAGREERPETGGESVRWIDATIPGGEERHAVRPLEELEREAIRDALAATGGNRREAARRLGIGLRTLYRKIRLFDLS